MSNYNGLTERSWAVSWSRGDCSLCPSLSPLTRAQVQQGGSEEIVRGVGGMDESMPRTSAIWSGLTGGSHQGPVCVGRK